MARRVLTLGPKFSRLEAKKEIIRSADVRDAELRDLLKESELFLQDENAERLADIGSAREKKVSSLPEVAVASEYLSDLAALQDLERRTLLPETRFAKLTAIVQALQLGLRAETQKVILGKAVQLLDEAFKSGELETREPAAQWNALVDAVERALEWWNFEQPEFKARAKLAVQTLRQENLLHVINRAQFPDLAEKTFTALSKRQIRLALDSVRAAARASEDGGNTDESDAEDNQKWDEMAENAFQLWTVARRALDLSELKLEGLLLACLGHAVQRSRVKLLDQLPLPELELLTLPYFKQADTSVRQWLRRTPDQTPHYWSFNKSFLKQVAFIDPFLREAISPRIVDIPHTLDQARQRLLFVLNNAADTDATSPLFVAAACVLVAELSEPWLSAPTPDQQLLLMKSFAPKETPTTNPLSWLQTLIFSSESAEEDKAWAQFNTFRFRLAEQTVEFPSFLAMAPTWFK